MKTKLVSFVAEKDNGTWTQSYIRSNVDDNGFTEISVDDIQLAMKKCQVIGNTTLFLGKKPVKR